MMVEELGDNRVRLACRCREEIKKCVQTEEWIRHAHAVVKDSGDNGWNSKRSLRYLE